MIKTKLKNFLRDWLDIPDEFNHEALQRELSFITYNHKDLLQRFTQLKDEYVRVEQSLRTIINEYNNSDEPVSDRLLRIEAIIKAYSTGVTQHSFKDAVQSVDNYKLQYGLWPGQRIENKTQLKFPKEIKFTEFLSTGD